jgi:hypothetical protein
VTDFQNSGQRWAADLGIEADFPEASIEEGYMVFTNEEILMCFEPVINRIIEMLRHEIDEIVKLGRIIQVILHISSISD